MKYNPSVTFWLDIIRTAYFIHALDVIEEILLFYMCHMWALHSVIKLVFFLHLLLYSLYYYKVLKPPRSRFWDVSRHHETKFWLFWSRSRSRGLWWSMVSVSVLKLLVSLTSVYYVWSVWTCQSNIVYTVQVYIFCNTHFLQYVKLAGSKWRSPHLHTWGSAYNMKLISNDSLRALAHWHVTIVTLYFARK